MSCHQPAYRSSADRDGTNTAGETRVTQDHRQHRQQLRRPGLTETDRQVDVGEPKVALGDLPAT